MSVLSRKQKKYIDKIFYQERQLREAVGELRAAVVSDAADSADPTARQAVEAIADLPEIMGYKNPEAWLRVVDLTWKHYHDQHRIGKIMRDRYVMRQSPQLTSVNNHIVEGTYWLWRDEFLTYAAMQAIKHGLTF